MIIATFVSCSSLFCQLTALCSYKAVSYNHPGQRTPPNWTTGSQFSSLQFGGVRGPLQLAICMSISYGLTPIQIVAKVRSSFLFKPWLSKHRLKQTTLLLWDLSWAAFSVFFQWYLKPVASISFSRSFVHVFFGLSIVCPLGVHFNASKLAIQNMVYNWWWNYDVKGASLKLYASVNLCSNDVSCRFPYTVCVFTRH